MAIAIFNDQQTRKGQKLGISSFEAWGARFVMFAAAVVGSYHIGNVLKATALPDDAHFLVVGFVFLLGLGLAYSEAVTSKSVYTKEQPKDAGIDKVGRLKLALILLVASGMGGYSFHINTERDNIKTTSHSTYESSFDDQEATLLSERNAARAIAKTSAERSQANANYSRGMAKLKREKSQHQSTKPLVVGDDEKWLKTFAYALFSLFCSSMLISLSRYLCQYYRPLVAFPFVGFQDKENESWTLDQAHGRSVEIDLAKSKNIRVDNRLQTPPIEFANTTLPDAKENRPPPVDTGLGAISDTNDGVGVRTLNDDPERVPKMEYSAHHYEAIKEGIIDGTIKPTMRPVKNALVSLNIKFVSDAERQAKATFILTQLLKEGVLIDNPEFGTSGKMVAKFILNPDYQSDEIEEQGEDKMISSICPECKHQSKVSESNLEKWDGLCGCPECGFNYAVMDNLAERKAE